MNADRLASWIVAKRFSLSLASIILVALLGVGAKNVGLDNHFSIFFDNGDPALLAYDKVQAKYTRTDNVFVALSPASGDVFDEAFLSRLQDFTEAAWRVPFAKRVDSITNFQHVDVVNSDLTVASLFSLTKQGWNIDHAKKVLLSEPELVNLLINADGSVTAVNVLLDLPKDADAPAKVMRSIRALVGEHFDDGVDIHINGIAALNHAFMEATEKDSATLMPLMFLVICVLLSVFLRSVLQTISVLLIVHLGMAIVVGSIGWLGWNLNMVNVVAITIVMTLAIADCVHLLTTYRAALAENLTREAALTKSVSMNLVPLFITSATTAAGFLALLFSEAPPIRELGVVTAISVMGVFFLSVTVFVWVIPKIKVSPSKKEFDKKDIMIMLSDWVIAKRKKIVVLFLVLVPALLWSIKYNELNDHARHYFDESSPFAQGIAFINKNITGLDTLAFSLDTGKSRGVNDIQYLTTVNAFSDWLRNQPEVVHVKSYADIVKRMHKYAHGGSESYHKIPTSNDIAAQYLLLYSMSTTYGLGIEDRVSFDRSASQVVVTLNIDNPQELLDLDERAYEWLSINSPDLAVHGVSVPKLFANIGINNIKSMLLGNFLAVLIIGFLLMLSFRSVRFGLVSMLPNLLPALVAIGVWGLIDGYINLAAAIVFSITLGIIVDDTVHFLHKFLHAYRAGSSAEDSVRYAFQSVGRAILITTLTLASGFVVMTASVFAVNSVMGALVFITLLVALAIDLLLLPSLLVMLLKKN